MRGRNWEEGRGNFGWHVKTNKSIINIDIDTDIPYLP